jgi:hypothetical protein
MSKKLAGLSIFGFALALVLLGGAFQDARAACGFQSFGCLPQISMPCFSLCGAGGMSRDADMGAGRTEFHRGWDSTNRPGNIHEFTDRGEKGVYGWPSSSTF